jgi:hypothetical protein
MFGYDYDWIGLNWIVPKYRSIVVAKHNNNINHTSIKIQEQVM